MTTNRIQIVSLALFMTLSVVTSIDAYERKVIVEDFTSTTCTACAAAAPQIETAINQFGEDVVSVSTVHVWWPYNDGDPWYRNNAAASRARVNFYGVRGVPDIYIDGQRFSGSRTSSQIEQAISNRIDIESPIQISLDVSVDENMADITVNFTTEENIDGINLYMSLNAIEWEFNAPNRLQNHTFPLLKMVPDEDGISLNLQADEAEDIEQQYSLENLSWHEVELDNLILVAWIQDTDSKEVLQSESFRFSSLGIDKAIDEVPTDFSLSPAFPNPFNSATTIGYELFRNADMKLEIFDIQGKTVETLVHGNSNAGNYRMSWNANVPSGVYFYRLKAGYQVETRKLLLLK